MFHVQFYSPLVKSEYISRLCARQATSRRGNIDVCVFPIFHHCNSSNSVVLCICIKFWLIKLELEMVWYGSDRDEVMRCCRDRKTEKNDARDTNEIQVTEIALPSNRERAKQVSGLCHVVHTTNRIGGRSSVRRHPVSVTRVRINSQCITFIWFGWNICFTFKIVVFRKNLTYTKLILWSICLSGRLAHTYNSAA